MDGDKSPKTLADESVHGEDGSNVTVIRVEVPKETSWWKSPAIYIAILAFLVAFWAEREARMSEYYAVDLEMCLLKGICPNKNGVTVPADPWGRYNRGVPK